MAEAGRIDFPIGLIGSLSISELKALLQIQKEKRDDLNKLILQLSVNNALQKIDQLISFFQEQMALLLDQIAELQKTFEKLEKQDYALETVLDRYRATGKFDWINSRHLDNKDADEALQYYLQRKDIDLEQEDIYLLLLNVQADVQNRMRGLRIDIEKSTSQYEVYRFNLENTQQIQEALTHGNESQQLKALNALEKLEKDMQIDLALTIRDNKEAKYEVINENLQTKLTGEKQNYEPIDLLSELDPLDDKVNTPADNNQPKF